MTDYWTYNRLKMPKLVPKIPIGWMSIVAMSKTDVQAATIGWMSKLSFRHRDIRHPADRYFSY